MKVLPFVSEVTGVLATPAGAQGMNFDAAFFRTRDLASRSTSSAC